MNTPSVSLVSCGSYDPREIAGAVGRAVDLVGGIGSYVRSGMTVLLKPNLLAAAAPNDGVTTHPAIFEAAASLCRDCGARLIAGDCGGYGGLGDRWRTSGLGAVARRLGVRIVSFSDPVRLVAGEASVNRRIEVARQVVEADAVINLPKIKTHNQMLLTVAVKNLFGCIVGARKPQWHLKSAGDPLHLGMMLVELCRGLAPALTVVDGVVGMEGNGPARGKTRRFGVVLAGTDCVAIDAVVAKMLGVDPKCVPVLRAAERLGVGESDPRRVEIRGERIEDHAIDDLKMPSGTDVAFFRSAALKRIVRNALIPLPRVTAKRCNLCSDCVEVCPTRVMRIDDGSLKIDRAGCISCFLCEEICHQDAITERHPLLGRLLAPPAR